MIPISFAFLILATGILTITTDVREHKIKNLHLGIISCLAVILYGIFCSAGILHLSAAMIINPIVSLVIGFIFYAVGLWKAGDAKLFVTYSLLLPVNNYSQILPLSCLLLLLNAFLIGFLIVLPSSLWGIRRNGNKIIKDVVSIKTLLYFGKIVLIATATSWIIMPLLVLFNIKNNIFVNFLVLFCGYSVLSRLINSIKRNIVLTAIFAAGLVLRYCIMPDFFSPLNFARYLGYLLAYSGVFFLIARVMNLEEKKQIRIPFSPFLFLGAMLCTTNFIWWAIKMIGFRG